MFIPILCIVGFNPCVDVDCGFGECALRNIPPQWSTNFWSLLNAAICVCPDGSVQPTQLGCIQGMCCIFEMLHEGLLTC